MYIECYVILFSIEITMNNKSLYEPVIYTTRINDENDAVITRGELDMICIGHFYKAKDSFYLSYPEFWKEDVMNLLKATNMYAELAKRYLSQHNELINHADFDMLLRDSCYIFSKKNFLKMDDKRQLYPITCSLLHKNELPKLIKMVFPKKEIFVETYNKFKELSI